MSQPVATAAPVAPTAPTPPSTRQVVVSGLRTMVAGTPGRLRLFGALAIVACLVFGAFAFIAATTRAGALSDARSNAAQLVRIQNIRINLVSADASLTNAFLVGGAETEASRQSYETGIANAARSLSDAAGANPADAAELAEVNDVITQYTGLVETARANNRQGYPIGAAYLRQATTLLRTDALPTLESISTTEQTRVNDAYSAGASAGYWLIAGLVLSIGGLVVVQVWLARRTRRIFNVPLAAATAGVLVMGLVLGATMLWSSSKAKDTRTGAYFTTLELATARVNAFDAKSAESLTLIARGSGQAYQARYASLAADTDAILADLVERDAEHQAATDFDAYDAVHTEIRELDDGGDWDKAVARATGAGAADSNARFAAFDASSAPALNASSEQVHNDLGSARTPLIALAWISLIAGIVAAIAAWRGVSNRLREYR